MVPSTAMQEFFADTKINSLGSANATSDVRLCWAQGNRLTLR